MAEIAIRRSRVILPPPSPLKQSRKINGIPSFKTMPTLNWIGKDAVVKHHKDVPFRLLEPDEKLIPLRYYGICALTDRAFFWKLLE